MATLAAGVTRIGTFIGSTNFILGGSPYAVGTTKVSSYNTAGSPVSWRNGTSFNNLSTTGNKDELAPGTAFLVTPSAEITVSDALFSFNTAITATSGFSSGFGA